MVTEYTQGAQDAYDVLRDSSRRQWYVVPLIVLVFYVYSLEVKGKRWRRIVLGIGFFFGELFIEIVNALLARFLGSSPWICSTETAYMITIGYTVEIAFFFALCPFILFNFIEGFSPSDVLKLGKIKIPVRFFAVLFLGVASACVEVSLNLYGLLTWDFWWWSRYFPIFQVLIYTSTMMLTWICYEKLTDMRVVVILSSIISVVTIVTFIGLVLAGLI